MSFDGAPGQAIPLLPRQPSRVPPLSALQECHNLQLLRWLLPRRYADDLPPPAPPMLAGRDPGDEEPFDPASAGSA